LSLWPSAGADSRIEQKIFVALALEERFSLVRNLSLWQRFLSLWLFWKGPATKIFVAFKDFCRFAPPFGLNQAPTGVSGLFTYKKFVALALFTGLTGLDFEDFCRFWCPYVT
jgi:hypothetical protein